MGSWLEKARLEAGHFFYRDMNRGPFTTDRAVTTGQANHSTQIYFLQLVSLLGYLQQQQWFRGYLLEHG